MFRRSLSIRSSIGVLLSALLVTAAGLIYLAPRAQGAERFQLAEASCYPVNPADVLDGKVVSTRLSMKAEVDLAVWWCATDTGLEENYRAGNFGRPCENCFRIDLAALTRVQLQEMDRAAFYRPANDAELKALAEAERLYEPRCALTSTAKTTQVLSSNPDRTIGVPRLDDKGVVVRIATTVQSSCYDWIVAGKKRYCSVQGLADTKGRAISAGAYVACQITLPPENGWSELTVDT